MFLSSNISYPFDFDAYLISLLFWIFYSQFGRQVSPDPFLQSVNESLESMISAIQQQDEGVPTSITTCAAECFRCLRQACALNPEIQSKINSYATLLSNAKIIMGKVISSDPDSDKENVLKCAAQFLGNACVSNPENQKVVWNTFLQLFR